MTAFSALPELWQTLIPLLIMLEAVLELGLFLYQVICRRTVFRCLPCAIISVILVVLLFSVTQGDPNNGKDAFLLGAPWGIFAAAILLGAVHFSAALPREYRRSKNELSAFSIKEAIDKLPMGICFSDPLGRIILCNDLMRNLVFLLSDRSLQIINDFDSTLIKEDYSVFPDGTVWQFRTQAVSVNGNDRWRQITAQNVTELYHGYIRQNEINEELREVNGRLREMYERMADDIKEKENLELKVYIHDTIGRSLLTIRDIIENGADADGKLEALREAVSVLSSDRARLNCTMDEVRETAEKLGVKLHAEGGLPSGSTAEALTAAAVAECVTNCVRHAGGNEVYVRIAARNSAVYDITITNNGKKPEGPIIEGSGLSGLRRRIEAAGGEMHTAFSPRFALLITLPEKENEL
ncbi:MAG TPA: ATP-binding protein [Ruminococcaceae bacterium]|nr:ATP-binding protein [Oscillospiraceae bacterium]